MGNATASRGLEVAVANLQEYCNGEFFFFFLKNMDTLAYEYHMFLSNRIIKIIIVLRISC